MSASGSARTGLWDRAFRLPMPRDEDFIDGNYPAPEADRGSLRVVDDHALRRQLIMVGYAEPLQSPRGRRRCAAIVRLRPPGGAGRVTPTRPRISAHGGSSTQVELPTIEELAALLKRIESCEREVARELQLAIDRDINLLKSRIATLMGDDFERAFRELANAVKTRERLQAAVREEALKRVDADTTFAPNRFVRLISSEINGV